MSKWETDLPFKMQTDKKQQAFIVFTIADCETMAHFRTTVLCVRVVCVPFFVAFTTCFDLF
jgi:hypothetical protein